MTEVDEGIGEADFRERVSPHELTGAKRAQWMASLWQAFSNASERGVVSVADAISIAEALHVDGEEHFLDEHFADRKEVTFKELTAALDDMSRASGNEYRDVDLDRGTHDDAGRVERVGLIEYMSRLCGSGDQSSEAVQYTLQVLPDKFTPKQILMLTTVGLLVVICVAVVTGTLIMWHLNDISFVEHNVRAINDCLGTLVETLEDRLNSQRAAGDLQTTSMIAMWSHERLDGVAAYNMWENTLAASRLSSVMVFASVETAQLSFVGITGRGELIGDVKALGFAFNDQAMIEFVAGAPTLVNAPDPPHCIEGILSSVMLSNNTLVCLDHPGEPDHRFFGEAATREADTAAFLATGGAVEISFINENSQEIYVPPHQGRCATQADDATAEDYCSAFAAAATTAFLASDAPSSANVAAAASFVAQGTSNKTMLSGVSFSWSIDSYVTYSTRLDFLVLQSVQRTVDIATIINAEMSRLTEIVVATRDPVTQLVNPQANVYAFADDCLSVCERSPPAEAIALAAFATHGAGWSIAPDYRSQPVIGSYRYVELLDCAILLERDVSEVRSISFLLITSILRDVNIGLMPDLKTQLVSFTDFPRMPVFPAYAGCPDGVDCVVDPRGATAANDSLGVYFRYDCRHCQRLPRADFGGSQPVDVLCTGSQCGASGVAIDSLISRDTQQRFVNEVVDGERAYVASMFIANYSVTATLIAPEAKSTGRSSTLLMAVGLGSAGLLVVGVIALMLSTSWSFGTLEEQWASYKDRLEAEKSKFGTLVKGLIPPAVAERLATTRIISDHVSTAAFVFVDVCQFSETTRTWSARYVARYMAYCVSLLEAVATHCDVLKLRSIGDLVVIVALRDEKHRPDQEYHPSRRGMQFASITMLLFSKLYAHRPQTSKAFREIFKDKLRDGGALEMPRIRIGVHCGPTVSGAFSISNTSHYDFFGPGPALANRMQQTALPNRIHATVMVKEMLRNRDPNGKYQFENSRKTVVRGHGTITSYFVRSVTENVPYELIRSHGIDYARLRYDFSKGAKQRQHVVGDAESVVSSGSDEQ